MSCLFSETTSFSFLGPMSNPTAHLQVSRRRRVAARHAEQQSRRHDRPSLAKPIALYDQYKLHVGVLLSWLYDRTIVSPHHRALEGDERLLYWSLSADSRAKSGYRVRAKMTCST